MSIYQDGVNYVVINKGLYSLGTGGSGTGVSPRNAEITLSAQDITNGYAIIKVNPTASPGEVNDTAMFPRYGLQQEYGQDFTSMVSDSNLYFYLIWKTSGSIDDVMSPVYPVNGLTSLLSEGDVIDITYYID